jgi:hypothetical protein
MNGIEAEVCAVRLDDRRSANVRPDEPLGLCDLFSLNRGVAPGSLARWRLARAKAELLQYTRARAKRFLARI